ncbi:MAG: hypothetical protein ABSC05_32760 [Candidatus Solibacter sp.]|jgi:hypothetical protein
METSNTAPDPDWKSLYRIGGICLFAAGVVYFVVTALMTVVPMATDAETYLRALAAHRGPAFAFFAGMALADMLFVPAALALYFALRHLARTAMLLAAALLLFYAFVDLTVYEINSMAVVLLSRQDTAAAAGGAQLVLAVVPIAGCFTIALSSAGALIASIVMLRGVFGKPTAYAGIAAAVASLVGAFYLAFPPLEWLLLPATIAYGLWGILAGARLFRLGAPQARAVAAAL